ncbi:MAG TPA: dihydroorotase [Actinomycetota bacterium]|nr:dihydroorotase [Actinomycetota bacterium]
MADLLLTGGRLIDPASGVDRVCELLIGGGVIEAVGTGLSAHGAEVVDVAGAVVCPGFVDTHVHLREPGREDEETIASGSAAAALGGYTAICAMPNTDPVCDTAAVAEKVASAGRFLGLTRVLPAGALTQGLEGTQLAAIGEMATSPARVRLFTDDGKGVQDAALLRRAMEYVKGFGGICAEHCDVASLSHGGHMHEGVWSSRLGLGGIPAEAEELALGRDLGLAKLTGVHFHALHVSTAGSVELIRLAKAQGLAVTAEATPHHLTLTDAALADYDTNLKVNPPLRSPDDVEAVRQGLLDGTIDNIATDHAPHAAHEKEAEFEAAPPGLIGLETALGVLITDLVGPGILSLPALVKAMSTRPARVLGLAGQGGPLTAGAPANVTVFDPSARWVVDPAAFASQSRNCPWAGRELTGRVVMTVFEGRVVAREGRVVARDGRVGGPTPTVPGRA